jgi:hypothetical protein
LYPVVEIAGGYDEWYKQIYVSPRKFMVGAMVKFNIVIFTSVWGTGFEGGN